MAIPMLPWKKVVGGESFPSNDEYPTEYRPSTVPDGGLGWFAKVDIPAGIRLRIVSIKDKTLHRFQDEAELRKTGWDIDEAVNYGIGHKSDRSAIFYLDPGTACNHADRTKQPSVKYNMTQKGVMEIWTILAVKAGDEMWIDYGDNFVSPQWYEDLMSERNKTPLSKLAADIDKMYQKPGVVDMRVTSKKGNGFYMRSAESFLRGIDAKDGADAREAACILNISGVGDAVSTALAVAASIEKDGLGSIKKIQTSYPNFVSFGTKLNEAPFFSGTARVEVTIYNNKK